MTKKELASRLAKEAQISNAKALDILNILFDANGKGGIIPAALDEKEKVTIPGFGTFGVRTRAARQATKPSTGEKTTVPERSYVFFKVGKTMKERMQ
jgi:DNA-binding protein HU-beta